METHCWLLLYAWICFPLSLCLYPLQVWWAQVSLNFSLSFPGIPSLNQCQMAGPATKVYLFMSSEMKLPIISGQWIQKRKKCWIRATAWESLHLQLCFPKTGMKIVGCCVSPSNVVSSLCVLASFWCKLVRPNSSYNYLFLTLAAWIIFQHCSFFSLSQGNNKHIHFKSNINSLILMKSAKVNVL